MRAFASTDLSRCRERIAKASEAIEALEAELERRESYGDSVGAGRVLGNLIAARCGLDLAIRAYEAALTSI